MMVIKNIHLKFIILSKFILKSPVVSIQAFSWPTLGDLAIAYDMTFLPRDLLQVRYNRCVLRIKGLATCLPPSFCGSSLLSLPPINLFYTRYVACLISQGCTLTQNHQRNPSHCIIVHRKYICPRSIKHKTL